MIAVTAGSLATLLALRRPWPASWVESAVSSLRSTQWDAPALLGIGITVGAIGLVMTAISLLPASRHLVELAAPDPHTAAALPARSLRRTLSSAATRIDGISRAQARIRRRSVRLEMTTGLRHVGGLQTAAESAVRHRLDALQPRRPRVVTSQLSRRES
ncbi:DUF6286 domain-containing protein [Nakamurella sp. UYEF19]|uniref:DUF6286 domain-containing protein n=1 Tax=Nakamurella sp. UYEF19 TaxID=1756392 RepID=UPI0033935019